MTTGKTEREGQGQSMVVTQNVVTPKCCTLMNITMPRKVSQQYSPSVLFVSNYLLLLEFRKPRTVVESRRFSHRFQLRVNW